MTTIRNASTETEGASVTFDTDAVSASFRVNQQKRTISGLVVPWDQVARDSRGVAKWRFMRNSLYWSDVSRVKLNLYHDRNQPIGRALRLQPTPAGLDGTFAIARGEEGDRVLSLAEDGILDGFSIEPYFEADDAWAPDPADRSIRNVKAAKLSMVGLVPGPAFDDARVSDVIAAQAEEGSIQMTDTKEETGAAEAITLEEAPAEQFGQHMKGLADEIANSHRKLTEELSQSLGESFSAGMKAALEGIASPQGGPEPVKAARYTVVREAPVYTMDGRGPSLVRDAWYASREHDEEAQDRLRKFQNQTHEVQKLVADRLSFMAADRLQFTTVDTTVGADVIPPGYRPDLFVPQLEQGRPFVNTLSRGTISNATPFVVPVFGGITTDLTGDHTEGSAPTEGAISFTTKTVTPGAISGKLPLTREIVDSSNPAIDQIALAAMREDYARQTETKVYTELNGANGVGGTITSGLVPSGAQASTTTGGSAAAGTFGGLELLRGLRAALALYPFRRFGSPTRMLLSQEATSAFATAEDANNRPLLASVSPQNGWGVGNAASNMWDVDGLMAIPAWAISGNAAGDADVFIVNTNDAWVWESPVLSFRFEEKQGPEIIELALFGYFAVHVLRPVGLAGIRHTVGA